MTESLSFWFCIFLYDNLITWCSKKQSIRPTAQSTAEAQYIVLSSCIDEFTRINSLFVELKAVTGSILMFKDNENYIKVAKCSKNISKSNSYIQVANFFV